MNRNYELKISENAFGKWESRDIGEQASAWTSSDVFHILSQRIQLLNDARILDARIPVDPLRRGSLEKRLNRIPKQPLATKLGLDSLSRWKLSKDFADAYSFLDCSGGKESCI